MIPALSNSKGHPCDAPFICTKIASMTRYEIAIQALQQEAQENEFIDKITNAPMKISEVFNLDCMIGMKQYPDKFFDLAVVDPPYGSNDAIGMKNGNSHNAKRTNYKLFANDKPEDEYFNELVRVSKNQIVWGGNFFGLEGGYICWNKNGTAFGEAELAFCSMQKSVSIFEYTWNGMIQQDMKNKEDRIHPTQKPVALYGWIYNKYLPNGGKVIDTHLGSGSNRIAADKAGNIDFTGYELDKDYYEAQEKRWKNYKAQLNLFA